jgi:AcrR family transcriptional regulator
LSEQVPATEPTTAPAPEVPPSDAAELDAIIAGLYADGKAAEVATKEEPAAEADEEKPAETEEKPAETQPEVPAEEKPAEEPEPGLARGLASLARRENKLREQEKSFREKEAQLQQLQTQLSTIKQRILEDPAAVFRELGVEKVSEVAAQLYYSELGDAAPKEFQEKKATWSLERKLEQLQRQIAEKEQLTQKQMAEARAITYLQAQTARIPDSLPFLKAEAADDSAFVARSLYQRITDLARAGALGDATTDEEIAAVAAQSLNDEIKRNAERYLRLHQKAAPPKAQSPVAEEKKPAVTKSLGSQATAVAKPRRPPANRDEEIEMLIEDLKSAK